MKQKTFAFEAFCRHETRKAEKRVCCQFFEFSGHIADDDSGHFEFHVPVRSCFRLL